MGKKWFSTGQIIGKLIEAELPLAQGNTVGEVIRKLGVTEKTYCPWTREYGGMRLGQVRRLKELEKEKGGLVVHLTMDNPILKEVHLWCKSTPGFPTFCHILIS